MKPDWWLAGMCSARAFTQMTTMTYAAAVSVLQREWGMSALMAGAISSGFQFGYALSLFVFSTLADRIGARRLYLWSLSASACFSLAFAFLARDAFSALVLYTLVGLSLGGTYTTGLMILAQRYPAKRRGMASGYFIASSSLGFVLSLATSGFAIPLGGYRLSFLLTGLGPVFGTILSWIFLSGTENFVVGRRQQQSFRKEVLSNRPARLLIGAYTFHSWELLGMWAWTPAFLSAYLSMKGSPDLGAAGYGAYLTAAFHMAGTLSSSTMGTLSDRLGRAQTIIILSAVSSACSLLFGWTTSWPLVFVLAVGLIYAYSALGDSPVLSAGLTEVVTPSYLGAAFGLRSLLGFGAGAISPMVFGAVLDWTNPVLSGTGKHATWGWAFSTLGLAGIGATWTALRLYSTFWSREESGSFIRSFFSAKK